MKRSSERQSPIALEAKVSKLSCNKKIFPIFLPNPLELTLTLMDTLIPGGVKTHIVYAKIPGNNKAHRRGLCDFI